MGRPPHGDVLINTMLKTDAEKNEAMSQCHFELELDERQLCDVELLMQGGFSPLSGYGNLGLNARFPRGNQREDRKCACPTWSA